MAMLKKFRIDCIWCQYYQPPHQEHCNGAGIEWLPRCRFRDHRGNEVHPIKQEVEFEVRTHLRVVDRWFKTAEGDEMPTVAEIRMDPMYEYTARSSDIEVDPTIEPYDTVFECGFDETDDVEFEDVLDMFDDIPPAIEEGVADVGCDVIPTYVPTDNSLFWEACQDWLDAQPKVTGFPKMVSTEVLLDFPPQPAFHRQPDVPLWISMNRIMNLVLAKHNGCKHYMSSWDSTWEEKPDGRFDYRDVGQDPEFQLRVT